MTIPQDFAIIDPHIHQWDLLNTPRILTPVKKLLGWNKRLYEGAIQLGAKQRDKDYVGRPDFVAYDYLPTDYQRDTANLNISHVVHVEAEWRDKAGLGPAGETAWVQGLFDRFASHVDVRLGGIVGYAEFEKNSITSLINAHREASPRLVGLRQMLAYEHNNGVMRFCPRGGLSRTRQWRIGFEQCAKHGLSFDAWFFHPQLSEMAELAALFPETQFILCHMGTPIGLGGPFASYGHSAQARASIRDEWQDGMARLAEFNNITVKLSGFFMPVVGWGYHLRTTPVTTAEIINDVGPYFAFVLKKFGPHRCMFASNFPMDKVSMSLATLYDVYWRLSEGYSIEDKRKLFHDNAKNVYKIAGALQNRAQITPHFGAPQYHL